VVTNNLPVDEVWREQANCKDVPLDNFFPLEITKQNRKEVNKTIAICKLCPVAVQCVFEAIVNDYDGIWGGSTLYQRYAYIRYLNSNNISEMTIEHAQQFINDIFGNQIVAYPKKGSKRRPKISIDYSNK
jgi:hypothetical protein